MANEAWFEGDDSVIEDASFKDYQITATPNDFNIKTIVDFVESGVVKIPGFQRNYVWDTEVVQFLRQRAKVVSPMQRMSHHEDSETVFG